VHDGGVDRREDYHDTVELCTRHGGVLVGHSPPNTQTIAADWQLAVVLSGVCLKPSLIFIGTCMWCVFKIWRWCLKVLKVMPSSFLPYSGIIWSCRRCCWCLLALFLRGDAARVIVEGAI
jgi:hypothetical protein